MNNRYTILATISLLIICVFILNVFAQENQFPQNDPVIRKQALKTDGLHTTPHPVATRIFSPEQYVAGKPIDVIIRIENPQNIAERVTVKEILPKEWSVNDISHNGEIENGTLMWSLALKPGSTFISYTIHPPANLKNKGTKGLISFSGSIGSNPIRGTSILEPHNYVFYETFFIVFPLAFFVVHFSVFVLYPQYKGNLFYSLLLLAISISEYISAFLTDPSPQSFPWIQGIANSFAIIFTLLFFYTLAFTKLPRFFWLIVTGVVIPFVVGYAANWSASTIEYFLISLFGIVFLESGRALILAIRNKVDGIKIIAAGAVVLIVENIWRILDVLNFLPPLPIPFYSYWGGIFLIVSMSIHLSYRFAKTNKNLAVLNMELEDRVAQRTTDLERANQELRELDKMKSAFVSQASHDLRTPLAAIKGSLDNLMLGIAGNLNEKQEKIMNRAVKSVNRLTDLVNDVLDLSRIESGRMVLEKSNVPMKTLVENIVNENKPAAAQKRIQLSAHLENDTTIHADAGKLERVVGELISNAIKYTPKSGNVDVTLTQVNDQITLSVKDCGIGMTQEECEKIWERFYRTNASKTFAKGSGLGLSIAKELVELHGGIIQVESEKGNGTTITLRLPLSLSTDKTHTG